MLAGRMRALPLLTVTLLLATLLAVAPGAEARDPPQVPPVCGDFYNWCDALVRDTIDRAKEIACESTRPSPCD